MPLSVYRSLLACGMLVATDAFTLVPFAPRTAMMASCPAQRALMPLRMDADADAKAAKVAAAKAKAAEAKAAKADAADAAEDAAEEKEETPAEKDAREAKEKAEAEAKAKAEAEAAAAKKKAEEEAAKAAAIKAAAVADAQAAVNMAGKEFGYAKYSFVVRWTEEAIAVGDGNWAALTEEVEDLCNHIALPKAFLDRGDAKCVAMIKALDQLQVALTGELATPAADLVPKDIRMKNRVGLVGKAFARDKALAEEEEANKERYPGRGSKNMVAQGRVPYGQGGRLW